MGTIIIIAVVVIVALVTLVALISKFGGPSTADKIDQRTEVTSDVQVFTDIMDSEVMDIYIAGLAHNCSKADVGIINGVVFNEKDNPVDRKAMAIGNHYTKKIVGYVPDAILFDYRSWCKREKRPCIGFIFWDGEKLRGRVRVYPQIEGNDRMQADAQKYAKAVAEHFGWELNEDGSIK